MKIRVRCRDKYEAQKLSSLVYFEDGKESLITEILNIVEEQIIVALKDKSAHSIILKDNQQVEAFADFLQSVFEKKHKIVESKLIDSDVEIEKE